MQCVYVAGYMTMCPLTRGVRLREVSISGGSTVLLEEALCSCQLHSENFPHFLCSNHAGTRQLACPTPTLAIAIFNNTLSVWPIKNCCCPDDTSIDTMIAWQGQTIQEPFFVHKALTREKRNYIMFWNHTFALRIAIFYRRLWLVSNNFTSQKVPPPNPTTLFSDKMGSGFRVWKTNKQKQQFKIVSVAITC